MTQGESFDPLFMPPEWQEHSRTLLAWPDQVSVPSSSSATLCGLENDILAIAEAISHFEPVTIYCQPKNLDRSTKRLTNSARIELQPLAVDELWIRDTGPVFLRTADHGRLVGLDLNFNYWGNKYPGTGDGDVARLICHDQKVERVRAPFTAEGGAIEVDGVGTLMLTESSVLNDNRNPSVSKAVMQGHLKDLLGVSKIIWLPGASGQEITDGHIDGLARFVAPGRIVLSRPHANATEIEKQDYADARHSLSQQVDARGRTFQIEDLMEADPTIFPDVEQYQLCLSYVNYLVVNNGVIIPSFGDIESDQNALQVVRRLFPDRKVEQVMLTTLCQLGGGIHCATQQVPKV